MSEQSGADERVPRDVEQLPDPEELPEDDGVLEPPDSLDTDDLGRDPLDTGLAPPDKWSPAERYGTTLREAQSPQPLDSRLAEEEPDARDAEPDPGDPSPTRFLPPAERSGRLVADDEGSHDTSEPRTLARDVGIDGGAAGAEEAAVHVVPDDLAPPPEP